MKTVEIHRLRRRSTFGPRSPRRALEIWSVSAAIVVAQAFDLFMGAKAGFVLSTGFLIAILLRRPAMAPYGFVVVFLAETAMRLPTIGLAAPAPAAFDIALDAITYLAARTIPIGGHRVRTGRSLIEILLVVAVASPLLAAGLSALLADTATAALLDLGRFTDWPKEVLGAAAIMPIVLVAGRDETNGRIDWTEIASFFGAATIVATVAWGADRWFPFPFIVASIPLLLAATRLQPITVAILGAGCMIEMGTLASTHADTAGAGALAAALTGVLPVGLALLLAELRTERRRMTEAGERLRQILTGIAGHGFCSLDRHGHVVGWDDKIAALTGFAAEAAIGRSLDFFFLPEDREAGVPTALLAQAAEFGRSEQIGWRVRADGTRFWAQTTIEATIDQRGAVVGFVKSVQDQTELQRSQSALMAAERRWGFALGSAGQGVWEHDLTTGRMQCSDVHAAMLGLAPDALDDDPQAWKTRVHPADVLRIPPDDGGEECGETELRLRHSEDRWIWIADRRRIAERDAAGRPIRVIGTHTDITARKLAEEKFRLAVEASPNGLLIADREGRITLANKETERMFGYEPGALLGCSIDILVPEARSGAHAAHRALYASKPTARRMGAGRDLKGRRRDGSLVPVEIGLNPITTAEGDGVLCVVTDITARKQTETDLAVSEARYRSMADNYVDLVVQLDLDLTRTWVSPASRDILGLPPEALLGSSPAAIVHPDDFLDVQKTMRAVAAGADREAYTARYRHALGHWIWLSVTLRLVRGSDDAPVGILAVARDITRAHAAEEDLKANEATFRGAMESASIGMALEEPNGRWVSVNRALCELLGVSESELVGCDRDALTHPDDLGIDAEQHHRLLAGEIASYQVEKRRLHRSGSVVWTHQSASLDKHPDGSPRRLVVQIQDITERKQIEQMKSEFVSMVSHELRTPLTSIRGALGLILGTMAPDLPPRAVQLVDIAHKNSERLIPLVNDILDLDKIDAGMLRVDLVETDAGQLVGQAVEATRTFADRFGVQLTTTGPENPIRVRVDEGRFIQVVTNLLSNAAKFSPRGGTVEVSTTVAHGRVRVSVRDEGPGIPEEFRARIFGRFAQADSATTRAKGGSGLGLHICRQIVSLMGGEIDFESTPGFGSTFWVEFPLAETVACPGSAATQPAEPRVVAILAREPLFAEFLAGAVFAAGFRARVAMIEDAPAPELTRGAVAILVDATVPASALDAFRRTLATLDEECPRLILISTEENDDGGTERCSMGDVWVVDPNVPHRLVQRLTTLVSGRDDSLPRILHIEDDPDFAEVIASGLAGHADVTRVARIGRALEILRTERFDLAVIDPILPDGDAFALLGPHLDRLGIPFLVLSAGEAPPKDGATVVHLVKSRVSEPRLVEAVITLLAASRSSKEEERHVG